MIGVDMRFSGSEKKEKSTTAGAGGGVSTSKPKSDESYRGHYRVAGHAVGAPVDPNPKNHGHLRSHRTRLPLPFTLAVSVLRWVHKITAV
jgi:hypothetical protein